VMGGKYDMRKVEVEVEGVNFCLEGRSRVESFFLYVVFTC